MGTLNEIPCKKHSKNVDVNCVDLFCGLGGLTHGLVREGINVVSGVDIDPACKFPYEANNPSKFELLDITKLNSEDVAEMFPKDKAVKLLAGCAPCQPFSTYSQNGRDQRKDDKWNLLSHFGRLVSEIKPDLVTMENVPKLVDHSVFKCFLKSLSGYSIWYGIVECCDYGIPQSRKRLVLLASRLGYVDLIEPGEMTDPGNNSVRQAIGHLPELEAGDFWDCDPLHASSRLSDLNLRRIRSSIPGGTWRDWKKSLRAKCHQKESGQTYPAVYGRMEWDKPAPTITTQCFGYGNGRFGHPEQDRAISLREAALLQSFPEDYQFIENGVRPRFNTVGRLIGNAVPVRLGELVGKSLIQSL